MQLVFYSKTSWKTILRVLPPTFKPFLQQIKLSQVAQNCCRKSKVVLLFATKSVHVARFTDPTRTCFTASEVIPIIPRNFIQSVVSIQATCHNRICSKTGLNVIGTTWTSLFKSFCSNVSKQVAHFVVHFYRSLRWDQSMHKLMVSYQSITVTYGHTGVKCLSFSD